MRFIKVYMAMRKIYIIGFIVFYFQSSYAQDYTLIYHPQINNMIEQIDHSDYFDYLNERLINPLDINSVTKEDLLSLGILDDEQIENLLFYIYTNGPITNFGELRMVEGFDFNTMNVIKPYFIIKPLTHNKKISNYLKQNFIFRTNCSFPFRSAFKMKNDSLLYANKKYYGDPVSLSVKYNMNWNNKYSFGINIDKDPGEQLRTIPDYLSFYFSLDGTKILRRLVAGDFKANFSQGLILNNGFSISAMLDDSFRKLRSIPFRKHSSWNETDYLRGVAAYFELRQYSLATFFSYKDLDASVKDSVFTSINKSGLHRTHNEIQNKRSITESLYGFSLSRHFLNARIDLSVLYTKFSINGKRLLNSFEKYSFNGDKNLNVSLGWSFNHSVFFLRGEEAISKSGGIALINYIQIKPLSDLFLTIGQRYLSPEYHSFHGKSYVISNLNNEEGYYFKMNYQPSRVLYISGYIDFFRIPLMKSSSPFPSNGFNSCIDMEFNFNTKCKLNFRAKRSLKDIEEKEDCDNSVNYYLLSSYRDNFQLSLTSAFDERLISYTSINYMFQSGSADKKDYGFHLSQSIKYKWKNIDLLASLSVFYSDKNSLSFYSLNRQVSTGVLFSRLTGSGYKLGTSLKWNINQDNRLAFSYSYLKRRDLLNLYSGLNLLPSNFENMLSLSYSIRI